MTFHKLPALSTNAMVSAGHSLITSTGLNVLRQGGNAMDASVAMALTASVVLPDMCGLGGDGFLLYYHQKDKQVYALNGSGHAPKNHTIDFYHQKGLDKIPLDGPLSISVPGLIDLLFKGLDRFGSTSFRDLSLDALNLANNGVPKSHRTMTSLPKKKDLIKRNSTLENYLTEDEYTLFNPSFGAFLEELADQGPSYFYQTCAADFVEELNALGASFQVEDFASFEAEWLEPLALSYRDKYTIYQSPLVSQGIIMLEMMGLLNQMDVSDFSEADWIHLITEAKKIAFDDRVTKLEDPKFTEVDVQTLLNPDYLKNKAQEIDMKQAKIVTTKHQDNHTTSFVVVDEEGNACSFIMSISDIFGSGIMDQKHGIIFNNRVGTNFHLDASKPNHIEGQKRTLSTLITYLVTDQEDNLYIVGNTPGGDNQPIWCAQNLVNVLDKKMNAQESLNQPKYYDTQSSNPSNYTVENILHLEKSLDHEVIEELKEKGHVIKLIDQASGSSHMIQLKDGQLIGASDPRTEATSLGY